MRARKGRAGKLVKLEWLRRNKRNRSVGEVEEVLELYGFIARAATKESKVWKRGHITLTLPAPKTTFLLTVYVALVTRKIDEAEASGVPEETPS